MRLACSVITSPGGWRLSWYSFLSRLIRLLLILWSSFFPPEPAPYPHISLAVATTPIDCVFAARGLVHEPSQDLVVCQRCCYALSPGRTQTASYLLRRHHVLLLVRKSLTTPLRQQQGRFHEPMCVHPVRMVLWPVRSCSSMTGTHAAGAATA
ncbi:hypothetical protein ASPBRDRAFT_281205 [Aspergillus brasiliensis CBS 101740]|uniref:Secreted protein n=1 Tax=Aspergillus brasiliensis (strain CBS 101740 / IMI 381727 / IBT 21946) TaxID=767769 RepID=A0A1L9UCZ4_ASPBC|nr:hypothetical protein ASPBRDRAFT_281205 [Aspergillus brasiliensis CBS 101740]